VTRAWTRVDGVMFAPRSHGSCATLTTRLRWRAVSAKQVDTAQPRLDSSVGASHSFAAHREALSDPGAGAQCCVDLPGGPESARPYRLHHAQERAPIDI